MSHKDFEFPEIITALPEADIPIEGLDTHLFQGEKQQMVFMSFSHQVDVSEHSHAAQWGVVLSGEIELTVEGKKTIYRKGDSYFIPANATHSARISSGYADLTFFDQKDRYKKKLSK